MSNIINNYPVFEDNQVLTASQLNSLSAYLEQQDRLTRSRLIGMGVGCGLEVRYSNAGNTVVTISKGIGVTSEGYLIDIAACELTKYRTYSWPEYYAPFNDVLGEPNLNDPKVWELITDDAPALAGDRDLDDETGFLDDKIVLLFMECFDDDNNPCQGKGCDEIGMSRVFNVRKLIIERSNLDTILAYLNTQFGCGTNGGNLFASRFTSTELSLARPLFDPTASHSTDYRAFNQQYTGIISGILDPLWAALEKSYNDYAPVLEPLYGENPFTASLNTVKNDIQDLLDGNSSRGFDYLGSQYLYDAIKDIIKAHNEFRNAGFDLVSQCCANMSCFPKHLILGEATSTGDSCLLSTYRTNWISSAVSNNQQAIFRDVVTMHRRLVLMVDKLDLDAINNPVNKDSKVTPSCEKKAAMDERQIPFYFDALTEGTYSIGTLEQNWNPGLLRRCNDLSDIALVGYDRNQMDVNNVGTSVSNPLQYDLDEFNWLRVGGVHNKSYTGTGGVSEELNAARNDFDLPYKVLNLSLVQSDLDGLKDLCNFDDLTAQYVDLREELKRNILMTAYKTQPGSLTFGKPFIFDELLVKSPASSSAASSESTARVSPIPITGSVVNTNYDNDFNVNGADLGLPRSLSEVYGSDYAVQFIFDVVDGSTDLHTLMIDFKNSALLLYDEACKEFSEFDFGVDDAGALESGKFFDLYMATLSNALALKKGLDQKISIRSDEEDQGTLPQPFGFILNIFTELQRAVDNFISSALPQQFAGLYSMYQYRLNYLAANDPRLFSAFIQQHPGIQHGAGAPNGGTYILLHNGADVAKGDGSVSPVNTLNADTVIGDFYLPYACCNDNACIDIPAPQAGELPTLDLPIDEYIRYNMNSVELECAEYTFNADAARSVIVDIQPLLTYDRNIYTPANVVLEVLSDAAGTLELDGKSYRESGTSPGLYNVPPSSGSENAVVQILEDYEVIPGSNPAAVDFDSLYQQLAFSGPLNTPSQTTTYTFYYRFKLMDESATVIATSDVCSVTATVRGQRPILIESPAEVAEENVAR